MNVISSADDLRHQVASWAQSKSKIAFVPTMGNLHEGHLSLVRAAHQYGDKVVVSIFVNPLQFGANEDLAGYPRTPDADKVLLQAEGVDVLFLPGEKEIYPDEPDQQVLIEVPDLDDILEGKNRPGHFQGVATVVKRLFDLVNPDVAIFGKKDYQQLLVIRRLVADLGLQVRIEGLDTVREADGLAMSSRNKYLSPDERQLAPIIYQTLKESAALLVSGTETVAEIIGRGREILEKKGFTVDYLTVCRQNDLAPLATPMEPNEKALVILIAARLGTTRLIDNLELNLV